LAGASRGIGLAIAQALSSAGASTILAARSMDKLEVTPNRFPTRALSTWISPAPISIHACAESAGDVDILVNVSGTNLRKTLLNSSRARSTTASCRQTCTALWSWTQLVGAKWWRAVRAAKSSISGA